MQNKEQGTPHSCVQNTEELQLPRPDRTDVQLNSGLVWFIDGSSSKDPKQDMQL